MLVHGSKFIGNYAHLLFFWPMALESSVIEVSY